MDNTEKIINFIGQEGYERVVDVMRILGVSFPEGFDIYSKGGFLTDSRPLRYKVSAEGSLIEGRTYAVPFCGDKSTLSELSFIDFDKSGYLEFGKKHEIIVFERDGITYKWHRNGNWHESISIEKNYRGIHGCFYRRDEGLTTSTLGVSGNYDFPYITSDLNTVKAEDKIMHTGESAPLEDYYEFFKRILFSENLRYKLPEGVQSEEYLHIVAKIFEDPINLFVYDTQFTDQSWRFDKERENAQVRYQTDLEDADEEYKRILGKAASSRKLAYHKATDIREAKLMEIDDREREYKEQLKLRKEGNQ